MGSLVYRVRKDEIEFKECPFCGNARYNFCCNVRKGVFNCWVCSTGGKISSLKKNPVMRFFDWSSILVKDQGIEESGGGLSVGEFRDLFGAGFKDLVGYLNERRFGRREIIDWKIMGNGEGKLLFPLYKDDELVYYVIKDTKSGHWVMPKGVSKKEVLWYRFSNSDSEVVLVEGIFDAMRVRQAGLNVMILLGVRVFEVHSKFLRGKDFKSVLFLDSDVPYSVYQQAEDVFGELEFMECPKDTDPADLDVEQITVLYKDRRKFKLSDKFKLRWKTL